MLRPFKFWRRSHSPRTHPPPGVTVFSWYHGASARTPLPLGEVGEPAASRVRGGLREPRRIGTAITPPHLNPLPEERTCCFPTPGRAMPTCCGHTRRQTGIACSDGNLVTFACDGRGGRTRMKDSTGVITYTRDRGLATCPEGSRGIVSSAIGWGGSLSVRCRVAGAPAVPAKRGNCCLSPCLVPVASPSTSLGVDSVEPPIPPARPRLRATTAQALALRTHRPADGK